MIYQTSNGIVWGTFMIFTTVGQRYIQMQMLNSYMMELSCPFHLSWLTTHYYNIRVNDNKYRSYYGNTLACMSGDFFGMNELQMRLWL
mgnify:CR=1 FL=1